MLGREDVTVTVLNDTVDTLMPGQAHAYNRPFSNYYGFILGIGMNCVYIETGKHIGKLDLPSDKSMIINSESGAYGRIASGAGGC